MLGTVSARSTLCSAAMTSAVTLSLRNPSTKKRTPRLPAMSTSRSKTSNVIPIPSRRRISARFAVEPAHDGRLCGRLVHPARPLRKQNQKEPRPSAWVPIRPGILVTAPPSARRGR